MLYDLTLSYERADWAKIDELANELSVPTNLLTSLYFNCMEEVNRVWNELTQQATYQTENSQPEEKKTEG